MNEMKKLHKLAILMFVLSALKSIMGFLVAAGIIIIQYDLFTFLEYINPWLTLAIFLGIVIVGLTALSWFRWYRFSYQLTDDAIRIKQGVIIKQDRTIQAKRIQSIHFKQSIFHRVFNLTELQIETAGSDMAVDALLKAVTEEEGRWIKAQCMKEKIKSEEETQVETEKPIRKMSILRLFIAGSTTGRFGAIFAVAFFLFSEIEMFLPERFYTQLTTWFTRQSLILIGIFILLYILSMWFVSILSYVLKYAYFTIERVDDDLNVTRGFIEKKQLSIPVHRIQAVIFKENLVRLPFRIGSVYIETAGGEKDQQEGFQTVIYPLLKRSEYDAFLTQFLSGYKREQEKIERLPIRSFFYDAGWVTLVLGIILTLVFIFLPELGYVAIGFVLLSYLGTYFSYRMGGYANDEHQLLFRYMLLFTRETALVKRKNIQMLQVSTSRLRRRLGLASIQIAVMNNLAGRHFKCGSVKTDTSERFFQWFSKSTER